MTADIYYERAGAGSAVTLLHSGVCDSRMWDPQWVPLAESFTVVGLERTHLVGSSFGGRVAMEFATRYPKRLDRLVLLCPALREYPETQSSTIFAAEEDRLLEAGDIAGATELNVRTWLSRDAPREARELVSDAQRHAFEVQLAADRAAEPPEQERVPIDPARIEAPTLVIGGGYDMDRFLQIARHLGEVMPNARFIELPWAWHLPNLERPAEVTDLLIAALS